MSLFQMMDRNQRLLKEFMDRCDNDVVLTNCYKNKLDFGCTYNRAIEERISKIVKGIEECPWWVDLLD
jgi:hypothetical protein